VVLEDLAGRTAVEAYRLLAEVLRALRAGGGAALAVRDEEWRVEGVALARARAALDAAWEADERLPFHNSGNRWTVPGEGVQLRLGRDGRWWPCRDEAGHWIPLGGPDPDPPTALAPAVARLGVEPEAREGI
jgi:hypothetical protein